MALSPGYDGVVASSPRPTRRTPAEVKALRVRAKRLHAKGQGRQQIATTLGISPSYVTNLLFPKAPTKKRPIRVPPTDGGVECKLCGDTMRSLGRHLTDAHRTTSAAYRSQFPGAALVSAEFAEISRDMLEDRGGGLYWTPARIIAAIQTWERKHGRAPSARQWRRPARKKHVAFQGVTRTWPTVSAVIRTFESWNAAMFAAGVTPNRCGGGQLGRQAKTCRRGHPLSGDNLAIWGGKRCCRECQRMGYFARKGLPYPPQPPTHCRNGHELTAENTRTLRGGERVCIACARKRNHEYEARQKALRPPSQPAPPRTHCSHGHELSGENLYVTPAGARQCRICARRRVVEFQERRRARRELT